MDYVEGDLITFSLLFCSTHLRKSLNDVKIKAH